MTPWKFTTVKQDNQPTKWQSYVEVGYLTPSCLAAHISSSGFIQISQLRSKASNWSSPSQVRMVFGTKPSVIFFYKVSAKISRKSVKDLADHDGSLTDGDR